MRLPGGHLEISPVFVDDLVIACRHLHPGWAEPTSVDLLRVKFLGRARTVEKSVWQTHPTALEIKASAGSPCGCHHFAK